MSTTTQALWAEHDRAVALIVAEMIGAANYLDAHPDYGTDEVVARTFREYVERLRAVEEPT